MILPLTTNPEEKFNITIFDVVYNMRQLRNTRGFWTLDIADEDGVDIIVGIKLVTQTDLLSQYPELPFNLRSGAAADPGRDDLDEFNLEVVEKDDA